MVSGALSTLGLTIDLSLTLTVSRHESISSTRCTSSIGATSRSTQGPAGGRPAKAW